jgi:hypothetical protein
LITKSLGPEKTHHATAATLAEENLSPLSAQPEKAISESSFTLWMLKELPDEKSAVHWKPPYFLAYFTSWAKSTDERPHLQCLHLATLASLASAASGVYYWRLDADTTGGHYWKKGKRERKKLPVM